MHAWPGRIAGGIQARIQGLGNAWSDHLFCFPDSGSFLLKPGRASLLAILKRFGIVLTSDQVDLLWSYHQRLRAANVATQPHENSQLREHGSEALCGQPVDPQPRRPALAAHRHGLGTGLARNPAEDRSTRNSDDSGRAAGCPGRLSERGLHRARAERYRGLPAKDRAQLSRSGAGSHHSRRGVSRRDAGAGRRMSGSGGQDDLHEGAGVRS